MKSYKELHPFEERKKEAESIIAKYNDRIPIILEKKTNMSNGVDIPEIDKNKYLVPTDLNFSQFMHIVRKRIKLEPEHALFFFIDNTIIPSNKLIGKIYEDYKDEDCFLYISYSGENTFGH